MKTIHDDLSQRSVDIHRPTGFDSGNADLFAHNTIVIAAGGRREHTRPRHHQRSRRAELRQDAPAPRRGAGLRPALSCALVCDDATGSARFTGSGSAPFCQPPRLGVRAAVVHGAPAARPVAAAVEEQPAASALVQRAGF